MRVNGHRHFITCVYVFAGDICMFGRAKEAIRKKMNEFRFAFFPRYIRCYIHDPAPPALHL